MLADSPPLDELMTSAQCRGCPLQFPREISCDGKKCRISCYTGIVLDALPVLPLRDVVVYPHMVIPLFVGRDKSMRALERAMEGERQILLVAQKSPDIDDPAIKDLHEIGTLAGVLQLLKLPDGTVKVLVEGQSRVAIEEYNDDERHADGDVRASSNPSTASKSASSMWFRARSCRCSNNW